MQTPNRQVLIGSLDISKDIIEILVDQAVLGGICDTFDIRLSNKERKYDHSDFDAGDEIEVKLKGHLEPSLTTVFKGYIDDKYPDFSSGGQLIGLHGRDYTQRFLWRKKTGDYYGESADDIVKDLVSIWGDFTTNNVNSFSGIHDKSYSNIWVFDAVADLADEEEALFKVDYSKDVWFKKIVDWPTFGTTLREGVHIPSFGLRRSVGEVINRYVLQCGKGKIPFDGDGWTEQDAVDWDKASGWSLQDATGGQVGTYCIYCQGVGGGSSEAIWYNKTKNLGLNLSDPIDKLHVWSKTGQTETITAFCVTSTGNYYYKNLGTVATSWTEFDVDLSTFSSSGSPSWSNINWIGFNWSLAGNIVRRVDGIYFHDEADTFTVQIDDTTSQTAFGIREDWERDDDEHSPSTAKTRAQAIVDKLKDRAQMGPILLYGIASLKAGDKVTIYFPSEGINNVDYRVYRLQHRLNPKGFFTSIQIHPATPSLSEMMGRSTQTRIKTLEGKVG